MMVDKRTLEGLDACRPGSDDLNQPELADVAALLAGTELSGNWQLVRLHRKLQSFDEQIGAAMHASAVPAGLADRLLARLQSELQVAPAATSEVAALPLAPALPVIPGAQPSTWLRRTVLLSGGALALAAAVLIAASVGLLAPPSEPLTVANLESSALDWYGDLAPDWQSKSVPKGYPVSARMLPRVRGWQSFSCPADRAAVAYDLTPQGAGHRVTLLVVHSNVLKLAGSPPSRPPVSTEGRLVATWREGDLVYVLVIEGSERLDGLYRRYVDLKSGPIA